MASTAVVPGTTHHAPLARRRTASDLADPVHQAFWLLRVGFTLAPLTLARLATAVAPSHQHA